MTRVGHDRTLERPRTAVESCGDHGGSARSRMHVLATAGHVDHGKSTLVRALTGMEPDRFAEERIGPAMAAIGAIGQKPEVHEFPVHEHFPR